jgi:hypothetical protein
MGLGRAQPKLKSRPRFLGDLPADCCALPTSHQRPRHAKLRNLIASPSASIASKVPAAAQEVCPSWGNKRPPAFGVFGCRGTTRLIRARLPIVGGNCGARAWFSTLAPAVDRAEKGNTRSNSNSLRIGIRPQGRSPIAPRPGESVQPPLLMVGFV